MAIKFERCYYTERRLFEQSLDIYQPTTHTLLQNNHNNSHNKQPPLIALVVGSAWLGHYWWIYRATSWWNSACPRTVVRATGTCCIAIRHRGSWLRRPLLHVFVAFLWISLVAGLKACGRYHEYHSPDYGDAKMYETATLMLLLSLCCSGVALCFYGTYSCYYHPAASLPDMIDDVTTAMQWISAKYPHRELIFGGYSSGGHVAALTLPRLLSTMESSTNPSVLQAVLYISPVLAVQGSSCCSSPQPAYSSSSLFTDMAMYLIWGPHWRHLVPSPLSRLLVKDDNTTATELACRLPHSIIMCRQEVPFGFTFLNTFFNAGSLYHNALCMMQHDRNHCQEQCSTYRSLESANHWTILASRELEDVLREEWSSGALGKKNSITRTPH